MRAIAIHDLILWLDEPGIGSGTFIYKQISFLKFRGVSVRRAITLFLGRART